MERLQLPRYGGRVEHSDEMTGNLETDRRHGQGRAYRGPCKVVTCGQADDRDRKMKVTGMKMNHMNSRACSTRDLSNHFRAIGSCNAHSSEASDGRRNKPRACYRVAAAKQVSRDRRELTFSR